MPDGLDDLAAAVARADEAAPGWRAEQTWAQAQQWLGYLSAAVGDLAAARRFYNTILDNCTAAVSDRARVDALVARTVNMINHGEASEATRDARDALKVATEIGYTAGLAQAWVAVALSDHFAGRRPDALVSARKAERALAKGMPGWLDRWCRAALTLVFTEIGELDDARRVCDPGVISARAVGDMTGLITLLEKRTNLEWLAGNMSQVSATLRELVSTASGVGDESTLRFSVDQLATTCAAAGWWSEAATLWASLSADLERTGTQNMFQDDVQKEHVKRIRQSLDPIALREASERGSRMTLAAAAEFALMLIEHEGTQPASLAPALSPRERELVRLVAQGRTNSEIATELFISVRTVGSHLDRIRDKTGHRRRADLVRLALHDGII